MGTDIEILIERYDSNTKKWNLVEWNDCSARYDDKSVAELPEQSPGENDDEFLDRLEAWHETYALNTLQRCYELFALLSNTRNEYDIIPYTQVRGIPDDISANAKNVVDGIVCTDMQFTECSWLTNAELMDIYTNDILRPNSVLHREHKDGRLAEFERMVTRFDAIGGTYRIIFWYA